MLIIAGIGLNSFTEDKVRKIILAGADVLRYNFSYRKPETNIEYIKSAQAVMDELNSSVKILVDLPINKIRLGDFKEKFFPVEENQKIKFCCGNYTDNCNDFVPINTDRLDDKVKINQTITLGDGEISLCVVDIIDSRTIVGQILNKGSIRYCRSFNCGIVPEEQRLLDTCKEIIGKTEIINPTYYAFSYINKNFTNELKDTIKKNHPAKTMVKIEKEISDEELVELCSDKYIDYIMIDRGEMGVNMPFEKFGLKQRQIIKTAKEHSKPVIISTHLLESTMDNFVPYRAEISDLTNFVIEGISGIMLCHETAVGQRPSYSVSVAKKIIAEAQKSIMQNK